METKADRKNREKQHIDWIRGNSRPRTFIDLPLGRYQLTDGIYEYIMEKSKTEDFVMYRITTKQDRFNSVCLFE